MRAKNARAYLFFFAAAIGVPTFSWTMGCSGSSPNDPSPTTTDEDAGNAKPPSTSTTPTSTTTGTTTTPPTTTSPPPPPPPPLDPNSGRTVCYTNAGCSSPESCDLVNYSSVGICASGCATNADCASGHLCVQDSQAGLAPSCLLSCTADAQCPTGTQCATLNGGGGACVPREWIPKGIGDQCMYAAECKSGRCTGNSTHPGWCTDACSSSNAVCAGDYSLKNQYGEYNWCVLNASNADTCFPGCSTNADCAPYAGTSCRAVYDVTGTAVYICAG